MCDNIIVLYVFMLIKIIAIFILPIIIFIKRKKTYVKRIFIIDLLVLLFIFFCNIFTLNKCIYNSSFYGIEVTKENNFTEEYNQLHSLVEDINEDTLVTPEKNYKTKLGKDLYYFNQNRPYMKNTHFTCDGKNIYINSFGSSITSVSIAISTLYDNSINPVQIFNFYKEDNEDLCNATFDIESIFNSVTKRYGAISISKINTTNIKNEIKNGGIVIAEVEANENSKLTCDHDYIVIYNIGLNEKLMIVSPSSRTTPYVCSYSSEAYGNTIDYDKVNMVSIDELDKESINYYLIKKE